MSEQKPKKQWKDLSKTERTVGWTIFGLPVLLFVLFITGGCDAMFLASAKGNVGRRACNATNGVYRGVIVNAQLWKDGNIVYEVRDDEGNVRFAPQSNVTLCQ